MSDQPIEVGGDGEYPVGRTKETIFTEEMRDRAIEKGFITVDVLAGGYARELVDLRKIGDTLQSEASRLAEFLTEMNKDPEREILPYEVHMAVLQVKLSVEDWTATRRKSQGSVVGSYAEDEKDAKIAKLEADLERLKRRQGAIGSEPPTPED